MLNRKVARKMANLVFDRIKDLQGILLVFLFSSLRVSIKLKRLQIWHESCMVLVNGPSLKNQINYIKSNRLTNELLAVNFFCNSDTFWELKPSLYCVADPLVFNDSEVNAVIQKRLEEFVTNFNAIDWNCRLFYPAHFSRDSILDLVDNPFVIKTPYNFVPVSGKSAIIQWLYSSGLALPTPESVVIPAIYLPITLGFKSLFLFGTDHSWIRDFRVNSDNTSSFGLDHFTGPESHTPNDRSVSQFMLSQYRLFDSHDSLRRYSDTMKCNIQNATLESFIDVYQKFEIGENN